MSVFMSPHLSVGNVVLHFDRDQTRAAVISGLLMRGRGKQGKLRV